jgi:hypothetical protein
MLLPDYTSCRTDQEKDVTINVANRKAPAVREKPYRIAVWQKTCCRPAAAKLRLGSAWIKRFFSFQVLEKPKLEDKVFEAAKIKYVPTLAVIKFSDWA